MYNYYSTYPSFDNELIDLGAGFAFLGVFIVLVLLIAFAVSATFYLLQGFALYTIAKKRGMESPFLAFIPFANTYYFGKIVDDIERTMNKKTNYALKLLLIPIASGFLMLLAALLLSFATLSGAPVMLAVGFLLYFLAYAGLICSAVFQYIALYKIFKEYSPSNATLYLILSILFGILMPIFLFLIRNNKSGYQIWLENQQASQPAPEPEPEPVLASEPETEPTTQTDPEQ